MSKILITGSNGFVGRALCDRLKKQNISFLELSSFDINLCNIEELNEIDFSDVSVIIHTAAKTYVPDSWVNPELFLNNNIVSSVNILKKCREFKIPLIYISAFVYDSFGELPFKETSPLKGFNPYALSKKIIEEVCEFYSKEFNISINVLRPFNIYGSGQNKHFLIPSILTQYLKKGEITVDSLNTKRDYIHIDDFVDACLCSLNCFNKFQIFNIGSGESHGIVDIIKILEAVDNCDVKLTNNNISRKNEVLDVISDSGLAYKLLGWKPKISFDEGVKEIYYKLKNNI
jgi:nucleoside-diphosphate-sugar epimerase